MVHGFDFKGNWTSQHLHFGSANADFETDDKLMWEFPIWVKGLSEEISSKK